MNVHGCGIGALSCCVRPPSSLLLPKGVQAFANACAPAGWYGAPEKGLLDEKGLTAYERPSVYTSVAAPTHDRNLRSLSKSVETSLLFGHVRAAGKGGAVHEYNCHPFSCGRYMFMHNGEIPNFARVKRSLLATLRDELFEWISGTTDSELAFALFLNQLPDAYSLQPPASLHKALTDMIRLIIDVSGGEPASMNCAVSDGEAVFATRFRNGPGETPPSLYYHLGPMPGEPQWDLGGAGGMEGGLQDGLLWEANGEADGVPEDSQPAAGSLSSGSLEACPSGGSYSRQRGSLDRGKSGGAFGYGRCRPLDPRCSVLVASEPLQVNSDDGPSMWKVVPPNTMLSVIPRRRCGKLAARSELIDAAAGAESSDDPAVVLDVCFTSLTDLARACPKHPENGPVSPVHAAQPQPAPQVDAQQPASLATQSKLQQHMSAWVSTLTAPNGPLKVSSGVMSASPNSPVGDSPNSSASLLSSSMPIPPIPTSSGSPFAAAGSPFARASPSSGGMSLAFAAAAGGLGQQLQKSVRLDTTTDPVAIPEGRRKPLAASASARICSAGLMED